MGKQKLKGKDLRKIGYIADNKRSLAINIMAQHFKHITKAEQLELLINIANNPSDYVDQIELKLLAEEFMEKVVKDDYTVYQLNEEKVDYEVFGRKFIDTHTIQQMDLVMRLPVSRKAALMPDAHVGYGLPIGGVLATENVVIPYGVGLDIGCRMALSIFDLPYASARKNAYKMKQALRENTHFGIGKNNLPNVEHEVLDSNAFKATEVLRSIHSKANNQLGSSGSGNHFVEFGEVLLEENNQLGLPEGSYLGLLSHSGSRGFGATVASYYTKVAMDICRLPKGSQHLAWLDLDKAEGQEYWLSMNLAGDYAKACHDVMHQRIAKALSLKPVLKVENHHNFAWKEMHDNNEWIVHRKGATPAKKGELGIIPASMTAPGYIVSGKGNPLSLASASHGAGRRLSRSKARNSITKSEVSRQLKVAGVHLIGGGVEEAPMAYKDIQQVINSQHELVNIEGMFIPKIIRMDKKLNNMEERILHISSGRGPAECMWVVAQLLKEVLKAARKQKLQVEVQNRVVGSFAQTLVSTSVVIKGKGADQFAKEWEGSVLWKGQSTFRVYHKRKNWFVEIYAFEVPKQRILKDADIVFQYSKSSGPGGQHANKTMSAVKAIHQPSGLHVSIQTSRSQFQNKKLATEKLKELFNEKRFYDLQMEDESIWKQRINIQRSNPKRIYEGFDFKQYKKQL